MRVIVTIHEQTDDNNLNESEKNVNACHDREDETKSLPHLIRFQKFM